jgi:hypothetical protein
MIRYDYLSEGKLPINEEVEMGARMFTARQALFFLSLRYWLP